jgi:dimethylamine monooxygenase subunit B
MTSSSSLRLRVVQLETLSKTLKRVTLEAADGGILPTSAPGAHLSLTLPGKERNYRNSYSITTRPDERARYEIIVRKTADSRGGSVFVHESLRVGDVLTSAMPNSQFPLRNLARKHLLIGGGIGLTPLLSFLPVLRGGDAWLELHQFCIPQEVSVFEGLLMPHAGGDIHVHGQPATDLAGILGQQPLGTHLYCCGPKGLMDSVRDAALGLGWPQTRLNFESFGMFGGAPFTVKLAKSGREIAVGEHESMLEALENAGVAISSLCRGGACGECLTEVVAGDPEHRDHFLSEQEKTSGRLVMPCVSRSKSSCLTLAR